MNIGDFNVRLVDVLLTVAVGLLAWVLVEMLGLKAQVAQVRQELIGIDGKNGLKGNLNKLTERVDAMDECLAGQDKDAGQLSERMRAAERDIKDLKEAAA